MAVSIIEEEKLKAVLEPHNPGEWELKATLRNHNYSVKDVSDNPDYWYKDIDLIATNNETGNVSKIEVKWDSRIAATGNLFIEFANPRSKGGKGWFEFCEADLLAYGDSRKKVFYMIKVPELKEFVARNKNVLGLARTRDGSQGFILPKKYIEHLIIDTIKAEKPNF
jgi:hypothetical protein